MNIAVAQSGGPTCAINASLMGVFKGALKEKNINLVYGSLNGIEGVINDNFVIMNDVLKTNADIELVKQTPSSLLKSCRYKLPDVEKDEAVYKKIIETFKKHDIGAFFYIGGNDSMDTVNKVSKYFMENGVDIKVMGVPKTIDNDLPITDHTPGFGSAAKYVATTLQEIIRDCSVYNLKSVTIVEIMGRDTGWLTASSAVLRAISDISPDLIYLPEGDFKVANFLKDIENLHKTQNTVIVAISEGVEPDTDDLSSTQSGVTDNFGHKYLAGVGKCLENIIRRDLGCKVRSIELNLMQRCASHIASKTDIEEAQAVGIAAVEAAMAGMTGKVMTFERVNEAPYTVSINATDAGNIANQVKYFPQEWINKEQNNVTDEAVKYVLPLIQGELDIKYQNGIPAQFKL